MPPQLFIIWIVSLQFDWIWPTLRRQEPPSPVMARATCPRLTEPLSFSVVISYFAIAGSNPPYLSHRESLDGSMLSISIYIGRVIRSHCGICRGTFTATDLLVPFTFARNCEQKDGWFLASLLMTSSKVSGFSFRQFEEALVNDQYYWLGGLLRTVEKVPLSLAACKSVINQEVAYRTV